MGHLVTGRLAGVPVNDIVWCTPANGRIAFAFQEPAWVGYSGRLTATIVMVAFYWTVIRRRLDSVYWWAAGVALLGTAASQFLVALFEGSDPQSYAEMQANTAGLLALVFGPVLLAAVGQFLIHPPRRNDREHSTAL